MTKRGKWIAGLLVGLLTMAVGCSGNGGGTPEKSSTALPSTPERSSSPAPSTPKVSSSSSSSNDWFKGGNLHKATVSEWKGATHQNKLATAADWLAGTEWKGRLNSPGDFDKLKVKAQMLVDAVDEVVTVEGAGDLIVTEFAAAVITTANDLGP